MDTPTSTSSKVITTACWCLTFFLLATIAFAGGHDRDVSHENVSHETMCDKPVLIHEEIPKPRATKPVPVAPNVFVPTQSTPPKEQNSPSPAPVVDQHKTDTQLPKGGGSQIWCSGPTAPGWRVDLPNGGCSKVVHTLKKAKIAPKKTVKPHKVVKVHVKPKITPHATTTPKIVPYIPLKDIPNTGYNPTLMQSLIDLLFGWVW